MMILPISARRFKMKDLGVLSLFLGIEFNVSKGFIEMKQKKYTDSDVNINSVVDNPRLYREIVGN